MKTFAEVMVPLDMPGTSWAVVPGALLLRAELAA